MLRPTLKELSKILFTSWQHYALPIENHIYHTLSLYKVGNTDLDRISGQRSQERGWVRVIYHGKVCPNVDQVVFQGQKIILIFQRRTKFPVVVQPFFTRRWNENEIRAIHVIINVTSFRTLQEEVWSLDLTQHPSMKSLKSSSKTISTGKELAVSSAVSSYTN